MKNIQYYVPLVATILFIIINIELIKKEKLKDSFAVFWISISLLMLICALNIDLLYKVAAVFGTLNVASILYSLSIFTLFVLGVGLSVKMSAYAKHIKKLSQQVAILTSAVENAANRNTENP